MKAFVLAVLCVGLTLGVCVVVRRVLDGIISPSSERRPAKRSLPTGACDVDSADRVLQQLTRFRTAGGTEAIHGTLVAEFDSSQREADLYVAFCPPFERLPDVDAHVSDELSATVNVAQRLHNGAQLAVRLAEPAEDPIRVTIDFFATEPAGDPRPPLAV